MILNLIKLANRLDSLGYRKESGIIDVIIKRALDPQVKALIESGQGWTYGCPSCNSPVDIDNNVFSKFMPEPIECPNCNNSFSPHDAGASRRIMGPGNMKGMKEEFGEHALSEQESGLWTVYTLGAPLFVFEGKANAQQFMRSLMKDPGQFLPKAKQYALAHVLRKALGWFGTVFPPASNPWGEINWDDPETWDKAEEQMWRDARVGASHERIPHSDVEFSKRQIDPDAVFEDAIEKSTKVVPCDVPLDSSEYVHHGESPDKGHKKKQEQLVEKLPKDEDGLLESYEVLDEHGDRVRRQVLLREKIRNEDKDPDKLADDMRW